MRLQDSSNEERSFGDPSPPLFDSDLEPADWLQAIQKEMQAAFVKIKAG